MDRNAEKSFSYGVIYAVIAVLFLIAYLSGVMGSIVPASMKEFADMATFCCVALIAVVAIFLGGSAPIVGASGTVVSFMVLTVHQEPLIRYLSLAAVLFALGLYGMVVSRNAIRVLMSIELMLNAVNINLVAFARYVDPVEIRGQVFGVFVLTVAAAEAAVGLAIVLSIYRNSSTVDMDRFNILKW